VLVSHTAPAPAAAAKDPDVQISRHFQDLPFPEAARTQLLVRQLIGAISKRKHCLNSVYFLCRFDQAGALFVIQAATICNSAAWRQLGRLLDAPMMQRACVLIEDLRRNLFQLGEGYAKRTMERALSTTRKRHARCAHPMTVCSTSISQVRRKLRVA